MRLILTMLATAAISLAGMTAALAADFKFEKVFAGRTLATGNFSAINGVSRDFKVVLNGRWDGKRLKLREDFRYADGERDTKTWTFTKTGPDTYLGTREDVVGQVPVKVVGNTARYSYDVYLNARERKNRVTFHDTMTLKPDGSVVNDAWVSIFILPVGKTHVVFQPHRR